MEKPNHPAWLEWSRRLQAIAQTGLAFTRDPYDVERYHEIRDIAAEMLAAGAGEDLAAVRDRVSIESGYATPKVDVRGVVFQDDKILLVKETADGKWTLPGGWADVGPSPAENAVKEVLEESGFQTRATKVLAVFDRNKHPHEPLLPWHVYKIFFLCELTGGAAKPSIETDAVGFFAEDNLPELSVTRITLGQIKRMFEHHRNPSLPTDFD